MSGCSDTAANRMMDNAGLSGEPVSCVRPESEAEENGAGDITVMSNDQSVQSLPLQATRSSIAHDHILQCPAACHAPCSCGWQASSVIPLLSIADPKAAASGPGQSDGSLSSNVAAAMQSVNAEAAAAAQDTPKALGLASAKGQALPADVDPSVRRVGC
jgi:hypothetical protein